MIKFYLIRHGETEGNKEGRFRGRSDFKLNKNGIGQANSLAEELKNIVFKKIYSSPLSRALQTAEIIGQYQDCSIITTDSFINISLGNWEGKLISDIKVQFPNLYKVWLEYPEKLSFKNMESLADVQKRSVKFIKELAEEWESENTCNLAIVTHRAVIKPLIAGLLDMEDPYFWKIHMDTAAYSIFEYSKSRGFVLYQLNQNKHLKNFVIEKE